MYYINSVFPSISNTVTDIVSSKGRDVHLHCNFNGKPYPLFSWMHNSNSIMLSNKYWLYSNGTLVVSSVSVNDSGQYICHVFNNVGNTHIIITMTVV